MFLLGNWRLQSLTLWKPFIDGFIQTLFSISKIYWAVISLPTFQLPHSYYYTDHVKIVCRNLHSASRNIYLLGGNIQKDYPRKEGGSKWKLET